MYTYNLFIFGHKMSRNKKLNNFISDVDIEFSEKIGKNRYECTTPYHGGVTSGMTYPVLFGTQITDDDDNPNYIDEVRVANKDNYINEYNQFLAEFKKVAITLKEELDEEDKPIIDELIQFFDSNDPEFYSLQVSS